MKLNLNPPKRLPAARPSAHPPTPQKHGSTFPMLIQIIFPPVSPLLSFFFFYLSSCFSLDRKTPEVFLVGNSWTGMLLREQAVREESRFSGSGPTPCSAIPSVPRQHRRSRVRTRSQSRGNSHLFWFCRIWSISGQQPPPRTPLHLPVSVLWHCSVFSGMVLLVNLPP